MAKLPLFRTVRPKDSSMLTVERPKPPLAAVLPAAVVGSASRLVLHASTVAARTSDAVSTGRLAKLAGSIATVTDVSTRGETPPGLSGRGGDEGGAGGSEGGGGGGGRKLYGVVGTAVQASTSGRVGLDVREGSRRIGANHELATAEGHRRAETIFLLCVRRLDKGTKAPRASAACEDVDGTRAHACRARPRCGVADSGRAAALTLGTHGQRALAVLEIEGRIPCVEAAVNQGRIQAKHAARDGVRCLDVGLECPDVVASPVHVHRTRQLCTVGVHGGVRYARVVAFGASLPCYSFAGAQALPQRNAHTKFSGMNIAFAHLATVVRRTRRLSDRECPAHELQRPLAEQVVRARVRALDVRLKAPVAGRASTKDVHSAREDTVVVGSGHGRDANVAAVLAPRAGHQAVPIASERRSKVILRLPVGSLQIRAQAPVATAALKRVDRAHSEAAAAGERAAGGRRAVDDRRGAALVVGSGDCESVLRRGDTDAARQCHSPSEGAARRRVRRLEVLGKRPLAARARVDVGGACARARDAGGRHHARAAVLFSRAHDECVVEERQGGAELIAGSRVGRAQYRLARPRRSSRARVQVHGARAAAGSGADQPAVLARADDECVAVDCGICTEVVAALSGRGLDVGIEG
eukprot:7384400-Prymnesium_polylepis.2